MDETKLRAPLKLMIHHFCWRFWRKRQDFEASWFVRIFWLETNEELDMHSGYLKILPKKKKLISSCLIHDFEKNALNLDPWKVEESSQSSSRGSLIPGYRRYQHVKRQMHLKDEIVWVGQYLAIFWCSSNSSSNIDGEWNNGQCGGIHHIQVVGRISAINSRTGTNCVYSTLHLVNIHCERGLESLRFHHPIDMGNHYIHDFLSYFSVYICFRVPCCKPWYLQRFVILHCIVLLL